MPKRSSSTRSEWISHGLRHPPQQRPSDDQVEVSCAGGKDVHAATTATRDAGAADVLTAASEVESVRRAPREARLDEAQTHQALKAALDEFHEKTDARVANARALLDQAAAERAKLLRVPPSLDARSEARDQSILTRWASASEHQKQELRIAMANGQSDEVLYALARAPIGDVDSAAAQLWEARATSNTLVRWLESARALIRRSCWKRRRADSGMRLMTDCRAN